MATQVVRALVQLMTAAIAMVAAFIAYCSVAESRAEHKARDFCAELQVGMDVGPLKLRALDAGASERQTKWIHIPDQSPWLPVTFTGAFPPSRHICSVTGSPKLVSAKYVYLD